MMNSVKSISRHELSRPWSWKVEDEAFYFITLHTCTAKAATDVLHPGGCCCCCCCCSGSLGFTSIFACRRLFLQGSHNRSPNSAPFCSGQTGLRCAGTLPSISWPQPWACLVGARIDWTDACSDPVFSLANIGLCRAVFAGCGADASRTLRIKDVWALHIECEHIGMSVLCPKGNF